MTAPWPDIPFEAWRDTCSALHLYAQIVGKYRLARTPWINHSWHATLYVDARGLTTSLIPDAAGVEIVFNLRDHVVRAESADGRAGEFPLGPMSVAEFHAQLIGRHERPLPVQLAATRLRKAVRQELPRAA